MREIRFRITYQHDKTGRFAQRFIELGEAIPNLGKRWSIIGKDQYAGLKGKNSKEIYEGDIDRRGVVKYGDYQATIGVTWDATAIATCIVAFDAWRDKQSFALATHIIDYLKGIYGSLNHGWYIEGVDGRQYGLTKGNLDDVEIIGNIYENPDLFRKEKK